MRNLNMLHVWKGEDWRLVRLNMDHDIGSLPNFARVCRQSF